MSSPPHLPIESTDSTLNNETSSGLERLEQTMNQVTSVPWGEVFKIGAIGAAIGVGIGAAIVGAIWYGRVRRQRKLERGLGGVGYA
ncbi:hypothetical protein MKZ38_001837 [Zalerion maritima]|uniref:Uncharacterized protein n=1 Tax=Zalerion maritima TaxID=339359 RepID=A0AAD5RR93_9PEZI|nr:hypothetical protein MKZ38_001837 [Zalerion maritima]